MTNCTLPNTWVCTILDDLAWVEMGQSPASNSYNEIGVGVPFFQGKAEFGEISPTVRKWCTQPTKIAERGDILMSIRAPVGPTNIAPARCCIGRGLAGIRAYTGVQQSYLFHFLRSLQPWLSEQGTGSTFAAINGEFVRKIGAPLPPKAEQTRIVEKLEELLSDLDAGVAELKAAKRKLVQYRQSLLKAAVEGALTADWRAARAKSSEPQESGADLLQRILTERRSSWETKQLAKFAEQGKTPPNSWKAKYKAPSTPKNSSLPLIPPGWVWASIEQIASDERYSLSIGPFGSNLRVPDYRNDGVPLVFVRNIRSGLYGGDQTKFVSFEKAADLSAHGIQPGDVLITKMGEPPGDADVYPSDQPPAVITADCIKVRCEREIMQARFLVAVMNSSIGKQQIKPITQGVAQKKVSLGRFSKIAVPVPGMEEQREICARLIDVTKEIDAQCAAVERSLKQSAAQRKNILKAAFSGQLVPQDPNEEPASELLERIRAERVAAAAKRPVKTGRARREKK